MLFARVAKLFDREPNSRLPSRWMAGCSAIYVIVAKKVVKLLGKMCEVFGGVDAARGP